MDTQELLKSLETLKNPGERSHFVLKQFESEPGDSYAVANRNGVISAAGALLKFLDEHDKTGVTEMPFDFFDESSDRVIEYITVSEPPKVQIEENSTLASIGCMAVGIALVAIFVVGCISVASWLNNLF